MPLFLEIKSGPMLGQKFKAQEGLRIGRAAGEIILPDSKISSLHAQIETNKDGNLVLVDRNSSNGTWIDEARVKSVVMMPGVVFRVGRTQILVVEESEEVEANSASKRKDRRTEWINTLCQKVPEILGQDEPAIGVVAAFNPVVQLKFIGGAQTDEVINLGYGPRKFGSSQTDVELKDPVTPHLAFQIIPHGGHPQFVTKEHNLIQLNNKSVVDQPLQDGDIISFGETRIRVSFLK